jgi:hypothetical protein
MSIEDHIDRQQFLLEFFGFFGRELGNPEQFFTEEPMQIVSFVEECAALKQPAFISVNPRSAHNKIFGIEKLFFDFDYGKKSDKLSASQIETRKRKCQEEVVIFLAQLEKEHIERLVVKTRKGFHVYIYLDKIYQVKDDDLELYAEVYKQLQERFLNNNRHTYKFMDSSVLGDVKRMCRIPTSVHEKSGEECFLVKSIKGDKIEKDKLRGIDFWKNGGLKEDDWVRAVSVAYSNIKKQKEEALLRQTEKKENWEFNHGFVGKIRYCFQKAMDSGEGTHQLRLALLLEAYWAGYTTPESMLEVFKRFHDYDEKTSIDQIAWFWKNKVPEIERIKKWKPYRCDTLNELNICLQSECSIYRRRGEKPKKR